MFPTLTGNSEALSHSQSFLLVLSYKLIIGEKIANVKLLLPITTKNWWDEMQRSELKHRFQISNVRQQSNKSKTFFLQMHYLSALCNAIDFRRQANAMRKTKKENVFKSF